MTIDQLIWQSIAPFWALTSQIAFTTTYITNLAIVNFEC